MGRGSTAVAASPQVTAVGLLGCADPTTLPLAAMMLTVYVSPDGGVDRTAKALVRGPGEVAGDGAAVAGGEPAGDVPAFAEGDTPACDPGPAQPATSTANARNEIRTFTRKS